MRVFKVREGGRVVPVPCLVATGADADAHRQVLGGQVTSEDGAGRLASFRDLVARGLKGVRMVISDAPPVWSLRSPQHCLVPPGNAHPEHLGA